MASLQLNETSRKGIYTLIWSTKIHTTITKAKLQISWLKASRDYNHRPTVPYMSVYFKSCSLRVWQPISLKQGAKWNLPPRNTDRSGTPSTVGADQEEIRQLRQSQRFERPPRVSASLNKKDPHLYKSTASRQRRWLLCLTHRNKHREPSKMKKKKCVSNKRARQNLKKDLSDKKISDLPNKDSMQW